VSRRREHGPHLSTRHVNEPNRASFSEEDPRPTTEKNWIIPGLRDAAVGVVHKRPQDYPWGRVALPRRHSSGQRATVLGPGGAGEDLVTFHRREHTRPSLG